MNLLSQTLTLLEEQGTRPVKKLGQNFLIDPRVIRREVEEVELGGEDVVLEVGPGVGNLTAELLERASRVVVVEKSPDMLEVLRRRFRGRENLEIVEGDFLELEPPHFNKVVANIPYGISSPFVFKLFDYDFELAVVIFQHEFARRLMAGPGTRDYSRISAAFSLLAEGKIISRVPPQAFYPQPEVDSAITRFHPKKHLGVEKDNYLELLHLIFPYRRKILKKALKLGMERTGKELRVHGIPQELLHKRVMHLSPEEIARVVNIAYVRE